MAQALADVLGASGGGATAGKAALARSEGVSLARVTGAAADKQAADVVLVPDDSGVMRPAADLAFDDAPWLDGLNSGMCVCLGVGAGAEQVIRDQGVATCLTHGGSLQGRVRCQRCCGKNLPKPVQVARAALCKLSIGCVLACKVLVPLTAPFCLCLAVPRVCV